MFKLYMSKQDYNRVPARVPQGQMTAHVHVLYTHIRATVETSMGFTCTNETGLVECKVLKVAVDRAEFQIICEIFAADAHSDIYTL